MSKSRPLRIGLSACFFHADPQRAIFKGKTLQYAEQKMSHWVMSNGAICYLLLSPLEGDRAVSIDLAEMVRDLDGILLQGGSDVAPESYGEAPIGPWLGDVIRDRYEIALIRACLAENTPILGVCRGAQIINVAQGGTLFQDIETQQENALEHRNWEIYESNEHDVDLTPNTHLATLYGATTGRINSIHHQAIKDLGENLVVSVRSREDGIIEGFALKQETIDDPYMVAVQWHPEFQDPEDTRLLSSNVLMRDFLKACAHRRG